MTNLKQRLLKDIKNGIIEKEEEIKASDDELELLTARLEIENGLRDKSGIGTELKEDFKYSAMALDDMIMMEKENNLELKKDLAMAKLRKTAVENLKK